MKFNPLWSSPFKFAPQGDDWSTLKELGGKGRTGVYLIRDNQDTKNLYVGKGQNIYTRLDNHMSASPKANKQIAERVRNKETFTIRWIESHNPELTESVLLIVMNLSDAQSTDDNRRIEWRDKDCIKEVVAEAERIGLGKYSEENIPYNLMLALYPERTAEVSRAFNKSGEQQRSSLSNNNGISSLAGINIEDAQALLQQLQRFQETIGGDWKSVMSQWQNLQNCWQDRQYDQFEPLFEQLRRTCDQCEQQCEEYTRFLEDRIRSSGDAAIMLNM